MPENARAQIWDVLAPLIVSGMNEELVKASAEYCQTYGVAPQVLEDCLKVCHLLLSQAARLKLDESHFRGDLVALSSEGQPCVNAIMAHYGEMGAFMRKRVIEGSLLDHGKMFVGLDWRIDVVGASDRGLELDLPVALLTLRYQEGYGDQSEKGKMSLYLVPEAVRELKRVCEQLEGMFESAKQNSQD
jgi:hypothetical protein